MNYQIDGLSADDLQIIGDALDLLPHGRVQKLVAKIQPQITSQEVAAREKAKAAESEAIEAWRQQEREKLRAELATPETP